MLIKNLGKDKKVAYLTPDYTYGHTVQKSMEEFVKKGGWTTVTDQVAPLGSSDYSSYLLNIANSGADVFININFGNDAVQSIKQAKQFGIMGKQTLVLPYYAPFTAKEVGPEIMEGVYTATDFWWTLEDKYPLAKMFVEAFSKKYGYKPEWGAEAGYQQVAFWADMVETAGTFYPPEVIKAYESGATLQSMLGEVHFRPGGPSAGAPRRRHEGQEEERDEGRRRLFRRARGRAGRRADAGARCLRLQARLPHLIAVGGLRPPPRSPWVACASRAPVTRARRV